MIATVAEHQTGQDNMNAQPEERSVQNAEKQATLPNVASQIKVNHIMEEETSSANEDDWTPNTIHSVKQKIHSTRSINNNGPDFFTITALVKKRQIKFIIDSGSPVTLIPKSLFNNITQLHPLKTEYRDVNDNRIQFE